MLCSFNLFYPEKKVIYSQIYYESGIVGLPSAENGIDLPGPSDGLTEGTAATAMQQQSATQRDYLPRPFNAGYIPAMRAEMHCSSGLVTLSAA